jgi:hypothetical protein
VDLNPEDEKTLYDALDGNEVGEVEYDRPVPRVGEKIVMQIYEEGWRPKFQKDRLSIHPIGDVRLTVVDVTHHFELAQYLEYSSSFVNVLCKLDKINFDKPKGNPNEQ